VLVSVLVFVLVNVLVVVRVRDQRDIKRVIAHEAVFDDFKSKRDVLECTLSDV
jgi:hypothetical protein